MIKEKHKSGSVDARPEAFINKVVKQNTEKNVLAAHGARNPQDCDQEVESQVASVMRKGRRVVNSVDSRLSVTQNYESDVVPKFDDSPENRKKDPLGLLPSLRYAIEQQYELVEMIGNGSYGFVAKGKCKRTKELVAIKIMKNETKLEYEIIKLLREL